MTSLNDRPAMGGPALLTPGEVAAAFRVDPKTVARWAEAGKLPCVRTLGGHRRFRSAEIEAALTAPAPASSTDLDAYRTRRESGERVRLTVEGLAARGRHDGTQAYIPPTGSSGHVWLSQPTVRDVQLVSGVGR